MRGINSSTGKALSGIEHLRQSVVDILTTPLGSRVMLRHYGSRLFRLVDAPANRETLIDIYHAAASALIQWEPRIQVERIVCEAVNPGQIVIGLHGLYVPTGQRVNLDGIVVTGAAA